MKVKVNGGIYSENWNILLSDFIKNN